jgi:pimeloyl-ACP methyl ester carboxylesterase
VRPFRVDLADADVEDLRQRLRRTRWPEPATVEGWAQGPPLEYVRELCAYWADEYDFGFADRINACPQVVHEIDGLDIHLLHVRSAEPDALPLVLTHGWPGSVTEFLDVIGPLTDPVAHGGDAADAFHVVVPSLPGYGWSGKPDATGWTIERIARAWDRLMSDLGYERYGAQGGDWGATIATQLAHLRPPGLIGIHVNLAVAPRDRSILGNRLSDEERQALADLEVHKRTGTGYSLLQQTRPQTIGYALTDSPAGQAAWILDKFWTWSDHDGDPATAIDRDRMLDDISVYWFTGSAASSARLYWESFGDPLTPVEVPSGISIYPKEIFRPSRRWAELRFTDLRWYEVLDRGGHFAAMEQPVSFVEQVRGFFSLVR